MNQPLKAPEDREFAFTDGDFRFLSKLAHEKTGIVLADHKRDMVYGRLARRLRALNLKSFADYCELVQSEAGDSEIGNLVNAITTNLTSFFREGHHFEHLRDHVIKPMEASGKKRLRIWSSACSAGMEPYSIAMTLKESLKNPAAMDVKILATDIDTHMLRTAEQGDYASAEFKNIPAAYQKYVTQTQQNQIQVSPELKKLIAFKQLNLLESWPMKGPFDAIFCRNVVIYFDKPTKQKLFARMVDMLKPDGFLYIGHSENLNGISDRFEALGRTIYRRIS